jgi:hypothetical protein
MNMNDKGQLHTGLQHTWKVPSVNFIASGLEEFNHTVYRVQRELFHGDNWILRWLLMLVTPKKQGMAGSSHYLRHLEKLQALVTVLERPIEGR